MCNQKNLQVIVLPFFSEFVEFWSSSLRTWAAYEEPKIFKRVRQKCKKIKPFFFFLSSVVNNNWNLKMNFGLTKIITVNTIMIIDYIVVVFVITYYIEQKQEYKYLTTCHSIIINLWLNRIRSDRRAVCNMEFATMAQPKFLCSTWFSKSLKRPATKQRITCIYEWDNKSFKGFFQKKNCNSFTCTHHRDTRFMFQKWNVKYKSGSKKP